MVIYLLMYNYTQVAGVQTAYEWDSSWILTDCALNCRFGQVEGWPPCGGFSEPGGPVNGAIATAFYCVAGPALEPFGRLFFITGSSGCLRQVEPAWPNGLFVVDCANQLDRIDPGDSMQARRLGKICVGQDGNDACDPVTPVDSATWGRIKAGYE